MIRTSIAAVALTLAAAAPSVAGGYETRAAAPRYDDSSSYTSPVTYDEAGAGHCRTRRHIAWTSYRRRVVRTNNDYSGGNGGSGYGGSGY